MTVYVPHYVVKKDRTGLTRPIDIGTAAQYGELVYLLEPSSMLSPESALRVLHHKLKSFCNDDYVLLIGDLAAVSAAVAVAASYNGGRVSVLKWDPLYKQYHPVDFDTRPKENGR